MRERLRKHLEPQLTALVEIDERIGAMTRTLKECHGKQRDLEEQIAVLRERAAGLTAGGGDLDEILRIQDQIAIRQRKAEILLDSASIQHGSSMNELRAERDAAHSALIQPFLQFLRTRKDEVRETVLGHLECALKVLEGEEKEIREAEEFLSIDLGRTERRRLLSHPGLYGIIGKLQDHIGPLSTYGDLVEAKASNDGRL